MEQQDVERIAKVALRELGAGEVSVSVTPESRPNVWRVAIGGSVQSTMSIRGGAGTSAQFIRDQIFEQFHHG